MKKAIIDVGSQSLRLLTFSNRSDLDKGVDKAIVCPLAKDLVNGYLKEERKQEALNILREFISGLRKESVFLYATSAVRDAKDGEEFIDHLRSTLGIQAEILSGEEEAKIGYEGVKLLAGDSLFSVLDLGGGSTELMTPTSSISVPMGVVRYNSGVDLEKAFKDLPSAEGELYGIGGSLSVFVALSLGYKAYKRSWIHAQRITRDKIKELTDLLEAMNLAEREEYLGEFKARKETIVPGGKILVHILDQLQRQELIYSDYSNLEGYGLSRGLL